MKEFSLVAIILFLLVPCFSHALETGETGLSTGMSTGTLEIDVLEKTLLMIDQAKKNGEKPVVIFDLDSTLFDNAPRNKQIIIDFAMENQAEFAGLAEKAKALPDEKVAWDLADTLRLLGETDETRIKRIKDYWYDRFFTDKYVVLDEPYPGAVEFVKECFERGAIIVYLTGRDEPDMGKGTRQDLRDSGFPVDTDGVVLLMKPEKKMKDYEFKDMAFPKIEAMGKVVASFDNEPKNVNMMKERFRDALVVFLDTVHSNKPDRVMDGIPSIKSFKRNK